MSHFLGNEEPDSSAIPVSTASVADRRDETEPLPMATLRLTDTDKGSKSAYPKNQLVGDPEVTTVDTYARGTVDSINLATVDTLKSTTLPTSKAMTVGKSDSNPFRATAGPETLPYRGERHLWVTEDGALVAQSRVKRIRIAQDVINSAEESVYDTLWNTKSYPSEQGSGDSSRVVQAGYDYLMKRTRLSKKTVQRIIDRLINKDFIAIEHPADIYRRLPTVYRVFDYRAVLFRHSTKGRTHVAKIGPGFTYAYPVDDPRVQRVALPTTPHQDLTTVVQIDRSTVVTNELPTEAKGNTVTGAKQGATTVVCETTKYIGKNSLSHSSASTSVAGSLEDSAAMPTTAAIPNELIPRLQNLVNFIDNDAIALLWNECRLRAADCTVEEVLYFAEGKAAVCASGRIKNPIGFLLTAVPKCFEGPAFVGFRKEQQRKKEEERRRQQREQERQKQLEEQGREEAEAYERGKQKLEALALDQYKALYEKTKEDFLARYPNALRSAPKTIEELVQQQMIRNLQD